MLLFSDGYRHSFLSDGGVSTAESSESEFEPGYVTKRRSKKKKRKGTGKDPEMLSDFVRTTGRSRGVVSYKDFYGSEEEEGGGEGGGGGEEGMEGVEEGVELLPPVEDNRETIEKILKKRIGKVGGTFIILFESMRPMR